MCGLWIRNYGLHLDNISNTHVFFHVSLNFLQALHIVNSLKITKTPYSVLTKMRYEKQNWMQGWDNGTIADLLNWPII